MTIGIKPPSGMGQTPGENGTLKTQNVNGKDVNRAHSPAKYVAKCFKQLISRAQNFAQTTAKANGVETKGLTMKSVLARYAGLNLLSIDILSRSAVQGNVAICLGGVSDVYDISTTSHTFFANGVLVHNSDTFRYVCCDVLREQFLSFSNRRKRNLYARDGIIHFYNPETVCMYSREIVYAMPNINGKFAVVHGKQCGDKWHIVDVMLRETTSTDEIGSILSDYHSQQTVIECAPAYFGFVRGLRKLIPNVKSMPEVSDVHRRIAATSDFVKNHLLFNEARLNDDIEYGLFMSNLLDYNRQNAECYEASAVLSGFLQFVAKFGLKSNENVTSENTKD